MRNSNTPYIFVYGTLKRGFNINTSLKFKQLALFYSSGSTNGVLYTNGLYPALIHSHSRFRVKGEIFKLMSPIRALRFLDKYEHAYCGEHEYIRIIVPVLMPDGNCLMCHTYIYNVHTTYMNRIEHGEFYSSKRRKKSLHMQL